MTFRLAKLYHILENEKSDKSHIAIIGKKKNASIVRRSRKGAFAPDEAVVQATSDSNQRPSSLHLKHTFRVARRDALFLVHLDWTLPRFF